MDRALDQQTGGASANPGLVNGLLGELGKSLHWCVTFLPLVWLHCRLSGAAIVLVSFGADAAEK